MSWALGIQAFRIMLRISAPGQLPGFTQFVTVFVRSLMYKSVSGLPHYRHEAVFLS